MDFCLGFGRGQEEQKRTQRTRREERKGRTGIDAKEGGSKGEGALSLFQGFQLVEGAGPVFAEET